jgi:hypothetical protein
MHAHGQFGNHVMDSNYFFEPLGALTPNIWQSNLWRWLPDMVSSYMHYHVPDIHEPDMDIFTNTRGVAIW